MDSSVYLLVNTVASFLSIYSVLLIIRILLTWFPTIDWYSQPFAALSQITDPYLNIFRSIIPPLGGIDFSPMLAIFALQLISQYLPRLLATVVSLAISSVA
jgi:YggT family protein